MKYTHGPVWRFKLCFVFLVLLIHAIKLFEYTPILTGMLSVYIHLNRPPSEDIVYIVMSYGAH